MGEGRKPFETNANVPRTTANTNSLLLRMLPSLSNLQKLKILLKSLAS
jgi:hypothetical protein